MAFGDRVKAKRIELGYSQQKLAEKSGISLRSVQNYESNQRYPNNINIARQIAVALGTTAEYLLSDEDSYVIEAGLRGGSKARHDVQALLGELNAMFAGGDMTPDDKDKVMRAIMDMYWESKQINQKYTPKKYRKDDGES
ncbi:MAG: helix-turn-helix transcriptional regulator [Clostridia bacterium]|nr:helix-turn-helix transcriptional regulator [Clostridia bacterium]